VLGGFDKKTMWVCWENDDMMVMGKVWENYEKILDNDGKHMENSPIIIG